MKNLYHSNVKFVFVPLLMIIPFLFLSIIFGTIFVASAFEPVAMILLGIGLLGLARSRRTIQRS
ncbi:hypothetical protein ACFL2S_04615 [Thermodesulfobacteriota bacterium]